MAPFTLALLISLLLLIADPSVGFVVSNSNSRSLIKRDMFTGIVEEMGEVVSLVERDDMTLWDGTKGAGTELTVKGDVVMDGAYLG